MGRVDSKTSEEGGSRSPAAIRIMRLLLFLLGFLLAASLADEKNQAEDGGGLSLSAEPGPGKEILLRTKRDPKKCRHKKRSKKNQENKNSKEEGCLETKKKKKKIKKKKDPWKKKKKKKKKKKS